MWSIIYHWTLTESKQHRSVKILTHVISILLKKHQVINHMNKVQLSNSTDVLKRSWHIDNIQLAWGAKPNSLLLVSNHQLPPLLNLLIQIAYFISFYVTSIALLSVNKPNLHREEMSEAPKRQEMSHDQDVQKRREERGGLYSWFVYLLYCILFHLCSKFS